MGHYLQAERIRAQCALSEERKALLWQQIIRAKISNQADVLRQAQRKGSTHLEEICRSVDVDNATQKEAQAARYYWTHLFGAQFRRERHGSPANGILNGYVRRLHHDFFSLAELLKMGKKKNIAAAQNPSRK